MKYPNKCCRCGFCCIVTVCPIGEAVYGEDIERCPALSFDKSQTAFCELTKKNLIPIGDGCCISAKAFKDGKQYDYASLSKEIKYKVVKGILEKEK